MSTLTENLVAPAGNGVGPGVDTSAMGGEKTITVQDDFRGTVNIEISCDGEATWAQVASFTNTGKKVLSFASQFMRVRRTGVPDNNPGLPNIDVSADDSGALFVILPSDGTPVDTLALGNSKTVIVQDMPQGGTINIQVSDDSIRWATCMTFKASDVQFRDFTAKFMRSMGSNGAVSVGAINDAGGGAAIVFGDPITVRGPVNAEGPGTEVAKAPHQHRLEYEVADEGVLVSARPRTDYVGDGVGVVDVPGEDLSRVTIPGPNLGDGGAVVKRSQHVDTPAATSGNVFVDGMSGLNVPVPIDGNYCAIWEGEFKNDSASTVLEVGISVNSVVAVVADSERSVQGNANDMGSFITSIDLGALNAGDLIRGLIRKAAGAPPQDVSVIRRNLMIIKVQ
jgi:hypothetical protein